MYSKNTCMYSGTFGSLFIFDSLSWPTLLLGTRAGTELACTSYVTGVWGGGGWGVCVGRRGGMRKGIGALLGLRPERYLA
jgi:hypothetical protein